MMFGNDGQNPPDEVMERPGERQVLPVLHLRLHPVPVRQRGRRRLPVHRQRPVLAGFENGLNWAAKIGLALSVGVLGGVGINTAHELGHKKDLLERWLSKITPGADRLRPLCIEHNRGHHVRVADPGGSGVGAVRRDVLGVLPRSVFGGVKSSGAEAARLERAGKSKWHWSNDVLNAWAMTVVPYAALLAVFGPALIPFILISAIFGFSLLENVNYLEHYGLLRAKTESGRYERCEPKHSWNPITSSPTCSCTTCSGTATTTPTRRGAIRRCAAWMTPRNCPPATRR